MLCQAKMSKWRLRARGGIKSTSEVKAMCEGAETQGQSPIDYLQCIIEGVKFFIWLILFCIFVPLLC